jgi:hypothetical protein
MRPIFLFHHNNESNQQSPRETTIYEYREHSLYLTTINGILLRNITSENKIWPIVFNLIRGLFHIHHFLKIVILITGLLRLTGE